mmetsp:Transcript_7559/g.15684  ORF Transcript_7559/g.15684 Transcript_7559/m.15684 type:complete len:511 (+) Transcript_7559:105-1637(+)|eukprot:CAMPEP_0194302624 /NCGR_PEP_ID=MMETSP0171-20130528/471_1 /TAXON_ID=218684 /ORGANISM="Corethron pennatum, Strain L29A3" /LENGTH=510 /DNA_ID=CAMNT_0039053167 /DNA_START=71 /DNA_END=1603 /DNA_ORIENTATION=-
MKFTAFSLSLIASTAYASYAQIGAGIVYEPDSLVTDHNAIDRDQAAIQIELAKQTADGFEKAKAIYEKGGNSKSVAYIKLDTGLPNELTKGTDITGKNSSGETINGVSYSSYAAGVTNIIVQYQTSTIQERYVNCQVGALQITNTVGCFVDSGNLSINGESYSYTYNLVTENQNGRTIQGFSTEAEDKMHKCTNCPYEEFLKYYNYYGKFDYANQWILAALEGLPTDFTNGNADFSEYTFDGRAQAVKKGTAYMAIYMYVIRELEDALDDCNIGCIDCNDDPVHAWDEGVAFYTGSTTGELLFALADKRCINFKTCGPEGEESSLMTSKTSKVNYDIYNLFTLGKNSLMKGDCSAAKKITKDITDKMAIPLIQGTLRYAYKVDKMNGEETEKAEGAVFAAAVLPRVHACSSIDAATIYNNMKVGASNTNFAAVKEAFENNYECMNIKCSDVGGIYTISNYNDGAEPCVDGVDGVDEPMLGSYGANSSANAIPFSFGLCLVAFFVSIIFLK